MIILCDFDETAAAQNVGQLLLDRFTPDPLPSGMLHWRDIRQRYVDREISLAEYQEIAFRQLGARLSEQARYVRAEARLRTGFPELAEYCRQRGIAIAIVSHGLDFYVQAALSAEGVDTPIHAVDTDEAGQTLTFSYPFADEDCASWPGNCKCAVLRRYRRDGERVIYAGDSASDVCPASQADVVFARGWLADYCRENGLPHSELTDFFAVIDYLETSVGESG